MIPKCDIVACPCQLCRLLAAVILTFVCLPIEGVLDHLHRHELDVAHLPACTTSGFTPTEVDILKNICTGIG